MKTTSIILIIIGVLSAVLVWISKSSTKEEILENPVSYEILGLNEENPFAVRGFLIKKHM